MFYKSREKYHWKFGTRDYLKFLDKYYVEILYINTSKSFLNNETILNSIKSSNFLTLGVDIIDNKLLRSFSICSDSKTFVIAVIGKISKITRDFLASILSDYIFFVQNSENEIKIFNQQLDLNFEPIYLQNSGNLQKEYNTFCNTSIIDGYKKRRDINLKNISKIQILSGLSSYSMAALAFPVVVAHIFLEEKNKRRQKGNLLLNGNKCVINSECMDYANIIPVNRDINTSAKDFFEYKLPVFNHSESLLEACPFKLLPREKKSKSRFVRGNSSVLHSLSSINEGNAVEVVKPEIQEHDSLRIVTKKSLMNKIHP